MINNLLNKTIYALLSIIAGIVIMYNYSFHPSVDTVSINDVLATLLFASGLILLYQVYSINERNKRLNVSTTELYFHNDRPFLIASAGSLMSVVLNTDVYGFVFHCRTTKRFFKVTLGDVDDNTKPFTIIHAWHVFYNYRTSIAFMLPGDPRLTGRGYRAYNITKLDPNSVQIPNIYEIPFM